MREIIHFHLGPRAAHLATHQWNVAESLFAYSDADVDHGVEHDVDWRQGIGRNGDETYLPRMILVDLKENFGALPNINALYGTESDEDDSDTEEAARRAEADKPQRLQIAEEIAPSPYQTFLSAAEPEAPPPEVTNPRYWSDYNRVFYHPRSLLPLEPRFKSQNSGGASGMSKWEEGGEAWASLKKSEQIDDSFRLFAEECDLLQGVQIDLDMSTGFGALASSVVEEVVKDEFPKGDVLALGLLGAISTSTDPWAGMQRVFTESATLLSLTGANALVLPLADPAAAPAEVTFPVPLDRSSVFETTALLSAHLSSALLPLRSKRDRGQMGMSEFAGRLNWRGDTRILGLEGSVPVWDARAAESGRWDFSVFQSGKVAENGPATGVKVTPFFSHNVLRGIPPPAVSAVLEVLQTRSGLKGALFSPLMARPPLPLAAPFPQRIFGDPPLTAIPIATAVTTSTATRHYLTHLVDNVTEFVRTRRDPRLVGMGDAFGRDEARELEESLRMLREAYVEEDEDDRDEPSGDERD